MAQNRYRFQLVMWLRRKADKGALSTTQDDISFLRATGSVFQQRLLGPRVYNVRWPKASRNLTKSTPSKQNSEVLVLLAVCQFARALPLFSV